MQKLRIRYAKRGRLRFASHRDLARTLERALRRAQVPMAFSAGFSPHPKISYLGAAPTGAASEAEYLEIGLAERCDPEAGAGRAGRRAARPDVAVLECVEAGEGTGSLADRIDTSVWRVELPGVDARRARSRPSRRSSASDVVTVAKRTKNGLRDIDAREAGDQRVGGRGGRLCHTARGRPAADARRTTRRRVGRSGCRRRPAPAVAPPGRA